MIANQKRLTYTSLNDNNHLGPNIQMNGHIELKAEKFDLLWLYQSHTNKKKDGKKFTLNCITDFIDSHCMCADVCYVVYFLMICFLVCYSFETWLGV